MLITNAGASERLAEGVAIVLGVGTRARHGPHVDDHVDFRTSQQGDEFRDWARRMTNREDLISDGRLLIGSIVAWHEGIFPSLCRRTGESHIMNFEESAQ